jgi:hypothetical protein
MIVWPYQTTKYDQNFRGYLMYNQLEVLGINYYIEDCRSPKE